MSATWRSLLRDERGFVITAELVLISTVLVLGLVAALSAVKTALAGELSDVAGAIGSVNQSYYTHGFHGCGSRVSGSSFLDEADSSDEQKADFASGVQPCVRTAVKTDGATPPAAPPCNPPCPTPCNPPCNGCPTTLPAPVVTPLESPNGTPCETPCGSPCETPCAAAGAPCGSPCPTPVAAPCGSSPCGGVYGSSYGGCGGSTYQVIEGWARFGQSVPRVVCPPGPAPFTGTDPFAPGAVSLQNMLQQGISYGGVCAPPAAAPQLPAPDLSSPPGQPASVSAAPQYDPGQWPRGTVY